MCVTSDLPISISVDLKKYRLRIHKATLHLLGDPKFVQLLVSPDHSMVATRCVDQQHTGDQSHRIDQRMLASANSIEIYSRLFTEMLLRSDSHLDDKKLYRLTGWITKDQRAAIFPLKSIEVIEEIK